MKALLADPDLVPVLAALPQARIVGGAVRDALAGRPTADIDLATPEPPDQVVARLTAAGLPALPTGIAHGTVTTLVNQRPFEITTLRRDVTTDGRHAEVAWTDDWREDAARRDFTINAMSLSRDGVVHDYFGGCEDLTAGIVRFVGDAGLRITEDYLRSLRFFRFYARYGVAPPDGAAVAAIADHLDGLQLLSVERVWSELKRILAAEAPGEALALMQALGVLGCVLPESAGVERLSGLLAAGLPADPLLRFAALLVGDVAPVCARLKLSRAEAEALLAWRAVPVAQLGDDDHALRRLLADHAAGALIGATWLTGGVGADWDALRARMAALPRPVFPLEGRDALALGAEPGPAVGAALRRVRAVWLAGGCEAGRLALLAELQWRLQG